MQKKFLPKEHKASAYPAEALGNEFATYFNYCQFWLSIT
jgi:hypothetical protein